MENNFTEEKSIQKVGEYTIEDALALIQEKKFTEAKVVLTEMLKADDKNPEFWKNMGLCNVNLDLKEKAFLDFKRVVDLTPDDATSWFYLANMADKLGNIKVAENAYKKVIELRPDYLDAYKSLVIMFMQSNQPEKIEQYEQAIFELGSSDYQIFYMIGTVYMAAGKYDKAIQLFEKSLEVHPNHPLMLNNLGSANLATGRLKEALAAFEASYEADGTNPVTHYNISVAARFLKDFYINELISMNRQKINKETLALKDTSD